MRLNWDCVRDILLCVEENTDLRNFCVFVDTAIAAKSAPPNRSIGVNEYQKQLLTQYSNDELIYHLRYCAEAGLVSMGKDSDLTAYSVLDLTVTGHELIGKIRTNTIWEKTKAIGGKVGAFGLELVSQISGGVIADSLEKLCHL